MAKELDGKVASKFREIKEIMEQPTMKAKLASFVDEAVKAKSKIRFEQENLKVLRDNAKDELGLKPNLFTAYVNLVVNNDYLEKKESLEQMIDLVDYVMEDQNLLPGPRAGDDE